MLDVIKAGSQNWSLIGQMKKSNEKEKREHIRKAVDELFSDANLSDDQLDVAFEESGAAISPYSTADKANVRELMIAYAAEYCRGRVNNAFEAINQAKDEARPFPSKSSFQRFMCGDFEGKEDVMSVCIRHLMLASFTHPADRLGETLRHFYLDKKPFEHQAIFKRLAGHFTVKSAADDEPYSTLVLQAVPNAPFLRVREKVERRFPGFKIPYEAQKTETEGIALRRGEHLILNLRDSYVRTEKHYLMAMTGNEDMTIEGIVVDRMMTSRHAATPDQVYQFPVTWTRKIES